MSEIKKMRFISSLEGVFHHHVVNNGKNIRYPITFDKNRELRGEFILDVSSNNADIFYSGRYKFGANELYIYQAIEALINKLEGMGIIDEECLDEVLNKHSTDDDCEESE